MDWREEDLSRHYRWVRGLALRLVADEASADDVVQESFLVALRRPVPAAVSPRAWLSGILRNLVRSRHRDRSRQESHLRRMARERPSARPEDVVARSELEHRIASAVLGLPEPLRTTTLLRYREDLSSTEIAERTGVPPGTVRWRLSRARGLLKNRLGRGDRDRASPWPLLVTTLFLPKPTSSVAGLLLMNAKTVAVALLVLTGLALLVVSTRNPGESPPTPSPEPGATGSSPTTVTAHAPDSPESGPGFHVSGRTVDERGRPLPGVDVNNSATDAAGRFRFRVPLTDERVQKVVLSLSRADLVARSVETWALGGRDVLIGDVVLGTGGTVRGRVVNEDGHGVEGAVVKIQDVDLSGLWRTNGTVPVAQTKTGEDGGFEFRGLTAGWYRALAVTRDSYYSASDPIGVMPGETIGVVVVVLEPLGERSVIEGRATEADGSPLSRATFYVRYQAERSSASLEKKTDGRGRFRFRVEHDVPHRLRLRVPDGRRVVVVARPGDRNVALALPEGEWRVLVVRDTSTGEPIEDFRAWLTVRRKKSSVSWPLAEGPHAEGRLRFPLPVSAFEISARAGGHREARAGPFEPDGVPAEVALALDPAPAGEGGGTGEIRGLVTASGRNVADARVRLQRASHIMKLHGFPVRSLPVQDGETRTDGDGRFVLVVPEGLGGLSVQVAAAGYAATTRPVVIGLPVDVDLSPGGAVTGTVRVPAGRSGGGVVVAASRADAFPIWTRTDADGRYVFPDLAPGGWQIEVRARAWDSRRWTATGLDDDIGVPSNCTVEAGKTSVIDLTTVPSELCRVRVRILLGNRPAPGYRAYLIRVGLVLARAEVLPDGTAELAVDEPGAYELSVRNSAIPGMDDVFFTVPLFLKIGSRDVELVTGAGRVEGRVRDHDGSYRSVGFLQVREDGSRIVGTTEMARDGTFVLPLVPEGTVTIDVDEREPVTIFVPGGGTVSVEIP